MSEKDLVMDVEEQEDSDDSSSSDSSDKVDTEEHELLEKANQLENDLSGNKYLYDTHVELVGIYKKIGDLNSLLAAFKRFYEYFPLTPTLWIEWINIEKSLATTPEQIEDVFKLFDNAVADYLSVELWTEYAQFSIGASNIEKTRAILERGVNAAGLVCDKGSLIWDVYREIEMAHVSLHKEGSEEWKNQILKVVDIFKRQLSVPLLEMDNTYSEWKDWCKSIPEDMVDHKPIEYGYKTARKILDTYKPFEEQLLVAESNTAVFNNYKEYIKTVKDPSTVICLYERAALQLCLVPEFWAEYCNYSFKLGELALVVCKKALRNCPWSEELWVWKLRILEHLKEGDTTIMECFEQGISSISPSPGLELWLTYLEYNRRCLEAPEKLDKLFNQAILALGFENDPQCKVSRLFSRVLAHRGDIKGARKLWGQILSKAENKGSSALWLEYASLEKQYGEANTLRTLFQKAINAIKDWPHYIMEEWLMYERHFGTLDDVMKCLEKCKEISISFNQNSEFKIEDPSTSKYQGHDSGKDRKRKFDRDSDRYEERKHFRDDRGRRDKFDREPEGKYFRDDRGRHDKFDREPERKRLRDDRGRRDKEDQKEEKQKFQAKTKPLIDKNPETTVFLSNLHPSVDDEKLKTVFPNAVNLDVVMDRKGKSRCFGYAQFKTQEEVMVALARDREPLDERPIFISEIKTEKTEKKQVFKYASNEEKNKLFVRGLPIKKTKEEIEEIFRKYGAKDVRLVLHKSGQPKGLAYVEFQNENQAQTALKETDQMTIDEHVISVAISAPPPKQSKHQPFGGTFEQKEEPIRHARSRLQTSLLPRSLQVKSAGEKKDVKNGGEGDKMKSNSDFRALLLKK